MTRSQFYTPDEQQQTNAIVEAERLKREEELRARINQGIAHQVARGKSMNGSHLVYAAADHAFTGLSADDANAFFAVPKIFLARSPGEQLRELESRTGPLLSGDEVNHLTVREGMVIGIAADNLPGTGPADALRTGVVYRDPKSGTLMFAESGEDGKIAKRPLAELLEVAQANGKKLFAGDLTRLADNMGARPIQNFSYDRFFSRFAPAGTEPRTPQGTPEPTPESVLRDRISDGIERYANDCIRRGVRYGFGDRSGAARIDCSGFVFKAARDGFNTLVDARGRRGSVQALNTSSEGQIDTVFRATRNMLTDGEVQVGTLKEGMIIGLDTGRKSWDRGRARDIDHVVAVFKDSETGRLMIAESASGVGVRKVEAGRWLANMRRRYGSTLNLYATDLVEMAEGQGLVARPESDGPTRPRTARRTQPRNE